MRYKHIFMDIVEKKPKTNVYAVMSASVGDGLGYVKWYAPWRQYCYFPESDTIYSRGCMADINDFIQKLMDERKVRSSEQMQTSDKTQEGQT